MENRWVQCTHCKRWVIKKDYSDHIMRLHIPQNQGEKENFLTTDDSGRLISLEDYAELHGGKINKERDYHDGNNINLEKQTSIFQKIADIKETKKKKPLRVECRYCHKLVKRIKIKQHVHVHHSDKLNVENKQSKKQITLKREKQKESESSIAPKGQLGNMAEAFKQAFNETRYGAKGMHHRHETDGKFGSTPLHDDYNDEADSD